LSSFLLFAWARCQAVASDVSTLTSVLQEVFKREMQVP